MDHIEGVEQILNVGAPVDLQVGDRIYCFYLRRHMRHLTINAWMQYGVRLLNSSSFARTS